ncbi:MAG: helix-turn-helix transcriptional regulator [Lachnospiraceae bacterium]|nr:helix-turn-helix transcriptional regulator [Lachnospiraceae bacterium]
METKEIRISLAAARVNAGMTQDYVSRILHVSKQTVVNWEKGKTEPKTSQAKQLSELYRLPYDVLIFLPSDAN